MKRTMILMACVIAAFLIQSVVTLKARTMDISKQRDWILLENSFLSDELKRKQGFKINEPKTISDAFSLFINEAKMFETYSGTRINVIMNTLRENEEIEDHYVSTPFRSVKGLPLTISVEKFSNVTDMAGVLNDIYLLEKHTDFKVTEISTENNDLIVKGELYGT